MADPLPTVTSVYTTSKTLQDTIEQLPENQKDVYKLARDLIIGTLELSDIRKSCPGDHEEVDGFLESLIKEFDTIRVQCEDLMIPDEGRLKRSLKLGSNSCNTGAIKKKIGDLRGRVRDAQQDFLDKNGLAMALNEEDWKGTAAGIEDFMSKLQGVVSELQVEIRSLVQKAESKPKEAIKIFGVYRTTEAERKAALRKATLDLSVTTEEEKLAILRLRIRTLQTALDSSAPTLYQDSDLQAKQGYKPGPDDPFRIVHRDTSGSWRRQDALIETVSLLGILQDPKVMARTPALVLFLRADELSWSLRSLGLRKEAMQLCTIAHQLIRELSQSSQELDRIYLAKSLLTVSACRGDMGRFYHAVAASKEAVTIYKALVEVDPTDAMRLEFGKSLNILSIALGAAGKWDEALPPIQEAVGITRALAEKNQTAYSPALAECLKNLSSCLAGAGKRDEALAPMQEAVEIRRVLAAKNPEFISSLAKSLVILSKCLSDAGKVGEVLAPIHEAVRINRSLADSDPETFNAAFALSLVKLSVYLSDAGKLGEALSTLQEAAEIRRGLAKANPGAFKGILVNTLNHLSNRFRDARKMNEALAPMQEAVEICRVLTESDPEAFNPVLADSLDTLSYRLSDVGKGDDALLTCREAEKMYRVLAESNPEAFREGLARSLCTVSRQFSYVGKRDEALAAIQNSVELYKRLYGQDPDYFCEDLADALESLRGCLQAVGRTEEANSVGEEADRIRD